MTGVELSHTVVDGDHVKAEFMDCVQRDINGEPKSSGAPILYDLTIRTPANKLNLFSELASRYDLDYLQTATLPFMPSSADKAHALRVLPPYRQAIRFRSGACEVAPEAEPYGAAELGRWQEFRRASIARN